MKGQFEILNRICYNIFTGGLLKNITLLKINFINFFKYQFHNFKIILKTYSAFFKKFALLYNKHNITSRNLTK